MFARLLVIAAAAVLAGCNTTPRYLGNENSPFYVVPAGSHVTVNQALTVAPEQAGVFIQNGEARRNGDVRFYDPYCRLELITLSNAARTVAPDDMVVRRSAQHTLRGTSAMAGGTQYASASILLAADNNDRDSGPTIQTFATRMELRSEKQPDVFRLTCAKLGYRGEDHHVTITEMRRTLGDLVTLRLPHQAG